MYFRLLRVHELKTPRSITSFFYNVFTFLNILNNFKETNWYGGIESSPLVTEYYLEELFSYIILQKKLYGLKLILPNTKRPSGRSKDS